MCEQGTWNHCFPYADRLNYCSALINNFALRAAVESAGHRDAALPVPAHAALRVLAIADHLTCVAAALMELGAMAAFLYLVMIRDYIYEHIANLTGARVTYTYGRIGGLARDLPDGWLPRLARNPRPVRDLRRPRPRPRRPQPDLHRPDARRRRDHVRRTRSAGATRARSCARPASPRDLRKDTPYLAYADLDFEVPVGIKGDNYDRYYVRMREMDESVHMIRQLIETLPGGPISVDDHRYVLPEKALVYSEIESLINHFKLVIDGPRIPAGEVYTAHEAANGELGFYLVSNGHGVPWKVHVRSPCYVHLGGVHRMLDGYQLADIVPTFGSVNMIGGECDR